ncbi:hypothetical protein EYS42_07100 [Aquabacterium lacunae]|uniref:Uncharacterized protein n=1 Tax=Aquabacterium lacunae TaxID=2528630 RepID=A0A4Q9H0V8_9BURK|nr:hypothetical protein [Aquabacterium lacunae]TBO32923.1 hypothetical protein EYS42_07100 [Aquabacterium lacunae]
MKHSTRQTGQSMVEFVVVAAALCTALFWPLPLNDGSGRSMSTIRLLISNFQAGYERTSASISLPE